MKNREHIYCGIDPGLNGAIAYIDGTDIITHLMPTLVTGKSKAYDFNTLGLMLKAHKVTHVCLERAFHLKQTGVVNKLINYGRLVGLVEHLEVPFKEVLPKELKRDLKIAASSKLAKKAKYDDNKLRAILAVKSLFPKVDLTIDGKPHDGLAEAVLLAEYCRRYFK